MKKTSLFLLGVAGACSGDGPLADGHIRGTIELDTRTSGSSVVAPVPPDPDEIHVGLAWYGDKNADPMQRPWALQEVPIVSRSNSWPMEFELAITEPPPAGAIHYELGYSQAKFVAYRDNGNGTLDWTPAAADAFIDSIVAYHPSLYLWFFDDGGLQLMLPGSNGVQSPPDTPITLLERSTPRDSCHILEATPRFAFESQRSLPADPEVGGPWDFQEFPLCRDAPPPGASLACQAQPGPGDYQYWTSWRPAQISSFITDTCGGLMYYCEGRRNGPTDTSVAWPCPCDPNVYNCVAGQLEI